MSKDLSKVKPLSLSDILKGADEPVAEIYLEEFDKKIIVKKLLNKDLLELDESKTDLERSYKLLYLMLRKTDPSITFEQVMALPADLSAKISNEIMKYSEHFLPKVQRLKEPSVTPTPKGSSSSAENLDSNQAK